MIFVAYRHGLRARKLEDLRWDQVDFATATLHVRRVKQGSPSTHPILGDELRSLRRLQREQEPKSPFVFTSERGSPFTTAGFARMVERAGAEAKLGFKAHPHMLRHACGFALASKGHDTRALRAYLGHKNIQHTVRYTSCPLPGSRTSGGLDRAQLAVRSMLSRLAGGGKNFALGPAISSGVRCYEGGRCLLYPESDALAMR
jgi:integrase